MLSMRLFMIIWGLRKYAHDGYRASSHQTSRRIEWTSVRIFFSSMILKVMTFCIVLSLVMRLGYTSSSQKISVRVCSGGMSSHLHRESSRLCPRKEGHGNDILGLDRSFTG